MELTALADLVGIIRDFALIFVLGLAILVLLVLYKKLASLLDSATRTMRNAEEVSTTISSRVIGRATAGSGVASAAGKLASFVLGFSRRANKGRGGSDG